MQKYIREEKKSIEEKLNVFSLKEKNKLNENEKLQKDEKDILKDKQEIKEQKDQSLRGKVKWFNMHKGYGFIEREDKEKDVFVHFSSLKDSGLKYLNKGEELTFEISKTDKGSLAINLYKISLSKKKN